MSESLWAVMPAAGQGLRMGAEQPKQYLSLGAATVIEYSAEALLGWPRLTAMVVAVSATDSQWRHLDVAENARVDTVIGGATRADSVLAGLRGLAPRAQPGDWVLVHDAARPCVRTEDLERLFSTCSADPVGGLLAMPCADTVKRAGPDGNVEATLNREQLWLAQTPQMFRYELLVEALELALREGVAVTDEASAMEQAGHCCRLAEGSVHNIKVTRPADLALAHFWLQQERN